MPRYKRQHLGLLREIVVTQFKLKDQNSVLGMLWSFLNPLLMLAVLFVFFRFRIGGSIPNYSLYLLVGIVIYTHFTNATFAAMRVLYNMKQLTCDTLFPKELLVIGTVLSRTTDFVISLCICVLFAFFSGVDLGWNLLMLPAVIVLQMALVLWVSLFLSCLYLLVRDIEHLYQVVMKILFFATPIFYDLSYLGEGIARKLVMLNPLTHLAAFARGVIISGAVQVDGSLLALLALCSVLFVAGLKTFKQLEPTFAEYV